jgi:hypothetical protein
LGGVQTETIALRDQAEGTLLWTGSSSADWLTLNDLSGLTPDEPELIIDSSGLPSGMYTATVTFNAAGMLPQPVFVTLFVNEPAGKIYLPLAVK